MAYGTKGSLVAGILAALGASACCAGPLIFLLLGVGGGWASHLIAFAPYSPYLTALTVLFMGAAFYNVYLRPRACAPDDACATGEVIGKQRILFWVIAMPALLRKRLAQPPVI
ncbi:MAG: mercuric transporter MerT family protein [Pseudomonadota bacterium]